MRGTRLLLIVLATHGCVEPPSPSASGWAGEIRDSAGVSIVENAAEGSVSTDPLLVREVAVLGGVGDIEGPHFGFVADATLESDTLYVLDALAQRVTVWGPTGERLRDMGGPGEGPGELSRFTTSLILEGDTLLVVDWGRGRVHRFLKDGTFLDAVRTPSISGRSWWRKGGDGRIYARILSRFVDEESVWRGRDVLVRPELDRRSGEVAIQDTVFVFEYEETDVGGPGRPVLPLLVNAPAWDVLSDGRLALATLDGAEVRIRETDQDSVDRIIRSADWVRRPPSREEEAALRELMGDKLVSLGGSRSTVDDLGLVMPERLPAVSSVRAGPVSTLWVQRMGSADDVHPRALNTPDPPAGWGGGVWDVLDAAGRRVTTVDLGPRVRLTRLTDGDLVGVRWDALGREEVVVWEVSEPGST